MLGYTHPLYFPKLIQEGCCHLKREGGESCQVMGMFRLDWSAQESRVQAAFDHWKESQHPDKDIPFLGSLPADYDERVKACRFAISKEYLRVIRESARQGLAVWSGEYPFDTIIRDLCHKPAVTHFEVAFGLLADCLYDQEAEYWDRSDFKHMLREVMLTKFWYYQTGRGLIERFAGHDVLKRRCEDTRASWREHAAGDMTYVETVERFLSAMEDHARAVTLAYEPITFCNLPIERGAQDQSIRG